MKTIEFLHPYEYQMLETLVVVLVVIVLRAIVTRVFRRVTTAIEIEHRRAKMLGRIVRVFINVLGVIILLMIWGVDQRELFLFVSSMLTLLGIAFFAQWSLLSNITSAVLLFINHPAKVGSKIQIMDKDYPVTGTISEIGVFFITIKTIEGTTVTIPNAVFIQRMISLLPEE
ncbi:MAG TPA: mechanosensitive ion channel protein MscS [Flavobacteriales bacterium]|nr:mechanosensitive ion channel protein MscS [Flavobacteriales bacterium]HCA83620.1 mechanosensitive ion channel protein MscS [Flavobacteriales bacterium]HRE73965.1 mechanosensitive ion channel [Flavobacteriales bacterium]HRE96627.1 mechanosensitive ion channel [Flavobacteriales bacterium]HRJ35802.1 mechanosensitive ion channel [Flavobacteriales bacterium]